MLVRADLPRFSRYPIAWLSGLAFFVPALGWMRVAHEAMFYSWLCLGLYCSWYFPLALWLLRRLDRRTALPLTFTVPVVWTALEFLRCNLFGGFAWSVLGKYGDFIGGFAWYQLGQSQHDFLPVIQVADLAGVAAVTFLLAAVNGLLAEAAVRVAVVRSWFRLPAERTAGALVSFKPQLLGVAAALAVVLAYGGWRLSQGGFADGPQVALLQTRIDQGDRITADEASGLPGREEARESVQEQTGRLTVQAMQQTPRPDLVIWPETSFPADWKAIAPGAPAGAVLDQWRADLDQWQKDARQVVKNTGTAVLLGLNTWVYGTDGKAHRYNSALLIDPKHDSVTRYDKMHLVPFGEYVPFRDLFPWLKALAPYDFDYSLTPGDVATRFHLPAGGRDYTFGVLICYEDADAPLAREYVRPAAGKPVDFLVNISNDGWFMLTAEHAEHLAVSRLRAVECRRALVRAVNGGISAVIDSNGRVVALPRENWAASQAVAGVVSAAVPIDTRTSLYARLGDWLPAVCWVALLVGCVWRPRGDR
jgi:apolipoprotein N-acyltransferase